MDLSDNLGDRKASFTLRRGFPPGALRSDGGSFSAMIEVKQGALLLSPVLLDSEDVEGGLRTPTCG